MWSRWTLCGEARYSEVDPSLDVDDVVVGNIVLSCLCFFFFSSRRRHTRFDCDWSSDVCSSDLAARAAITRAIRAVVDRRPPVPWRQAARAQDRSTVVHETVNARTRTGEKSWRDRKSVV